MQPITARSRQIGMTRNCRTLLIASAAAVPLLAACSSTPSAAGGTGAAPGRQAAHRGLVGAPGAPVPAPTAANGPSYQTLKLAGQQPARLTRITVPSQSIIYTADLVLRVNNVTTVAAVATGIVTGAGGYVAGEQTNQRQGTTPQVSLTLKIPVAAYYATLSHLAGLGHQLAFGEHAVDVTQQVADVTSRVASTEAAIRQLRALLSRAGSIPALLTVQDQINSQESDLEALLAQQQALAHETSYATVSVVLIGHHPRIVKHHHKKAGTRHNFVTGLSAGWHALTTAVSWALTVLGAILPFAVILAVIAGIGLVGRRRVTRRKAPPAATPPAEAA